MNSDSSTAEATTPPDSCDNFPSDVLKWMKINASPLMSLKLMQVCKYFQRKQFPYLVLYGIAKSNDGTWTYEDDEIHTTSNMNIFSDGSLWITSYLYLYQKVEPISSILSKIAVCQATYFYCESQNYSLNELKALTSCGTFKYVTFINTTITNKDGNAAALESILQCLPNVTYITFDTIMPSIKSLQDAANLNLSKLKLFEGYRVLETFDFKTFTEFMKEHPFIQWRLSYNNQFILSPEYKLQLEQYITRILNDDMIDGHPPPIIHFPEQGQQITTDLLHERYEARYHELNGT